MSLRKHLRQDRFESQAHVCRLQAPLFLLIVENPDLAHKITEISDKELSIRYDAVEPAMPDGM